MRVDSLQEQEGWRGYIPQPCERQYNSRQFRGLSRTAKNSKKQRRASLFFARADWPQARISAAKPMSLAVNFGRNSENSDGGFEVTMCRGARPGRLPSSLPDLVAAPSAD